MLIVYMYRRPPPWGDAIALNSSQACSSMD